MLKKTAQKGAGAEAETEAAAAAAEAGEGQTGLLLAALLTPIKTGRHFIALAYQICWCLGINKSSNKYELRTLPPPCLPPSNKTKVTSPNEPHATASFSISCYLPCLLRKCQLFCKFQRQVFPRLLFASFSLFLPALLLFLLVAFFMRLCVLP